MSTHPTTIEITKEQRLSVNGDCIVGVNSSKGISELPADLKRILSNPKGRGRVILRTGSFDFVVEGYGDHRLTFSHPTELVVRKSGFASDRTLMVHADKAARDLPRDMVRLLKNPLTMITVEVSARITE